MLDVIWLVLAAAASLLGFACLALSLPHHGRAVRGAALPAARARRLRACGYPLLVVSGAFSVLRDGASFGSVLAVMVLITSAWAVAFTLTWRPHWLRPLAWPRRASAATREVSVASLVTTVVCLTCLIVGVLGFACPMPRPAVRPAEPPPIVVEQIAERASVELTAEPAGPSAAPEAAPADPVRPSPPAHVAAPPLPALIAVTLPGAQTDFVLPVQVRSHLADTRPSSHARQPGPVTTAAAAPAPVAQILTFGEGEGKQPAPVYPSQALREGQEGAVVVRFQLGDDGRVRSAELARPSPWPLLNSAALRVVRERWSFRSGRVRLYEVSIHFELSK